MASFRKRGKTWYYRFTDADGVKREVAGCADKRATQELARHAESESARERAGMVDPKARRIAEAARRPIGEHLDEFIRVMESKGGDPKHVRSTRTYIDRILTLARIERTPDLNPSAVTEALGKLRDQEFSARSINAHATAIKGLSRWLWRDGRTVDYSLNAVAKLNEASDRRRVRRVLTPDELGRLIEATRTAPPWRGLPGTDRAMLYMVAASTGFRRSELASLTPESFRLDSEPPTIVCEASYTKNGRLAEQPIPDSLATVLRPWMASKEPTRPVFHPLPEKTGLMLAKDLERVGIKPVDDQGQVVDMHSLRHGYITALAKAGVPVKTLQTLARHSDPKLTLNVYSHLTVFDTASALDALPDLTPGKISGPEPLAMTGTDPVVTPISNLVAHYLPTGGEGNGGYVRDSEVKVGLDSQMEMGCNSLEAKGVEGLGGEGMESEASAPRRTRTYNPLIKSQHADRNNPLPANSLRVFSLPVAHHLPTDTRRTPSDLAEVIDHWDRLPDAIRAAIMALVKTASSSPRDH